jgi:hypothetical protein
MEELLVINPPLVLGCLGLGAGLLAYGGWRRDMFNRKKKLAELAAEAQRTEVEQARQAEEAERMRLIAESRIPDGAVYVCHDGIPLPNAGVLDGALMVVLIGTPGTNGGLRFLIRLVQAGLSNLVGSILVVESDEVMRRKFEQALPAVYQDRVTYGFIDEFRGGFSNDHVEAVRAYIGRWGVELQDAATKAVRLHMRRNNVRPAESLVHTTLGGHTYPGAVVVKAIHDQLPETRIFGAIDLPCDEPQRQDLLVMQSIYKQAGLYGAILTDSLEPNSETTDTALADLLVGFYAASLQSGKSPRLNNIFTRVLPHGGGGFARFEYVYGQVVAHHFQPHPSIAPRYYVQRKHVASEVKRLVEELEQQRGVRSVNVPAGVEERSVYDLMLVAIGPDDLLDVADYVQAARKLEKEQLTANGANTPVLFGEPNYHTLFASYAPGINPDEPYCDLAVMRLQAVADAEQNLGEIVKAPTKRAQAKGPAMIAPTSKPVHHNGVVEGVEG